MARLSAWLGEHDPGGVDMRRAIHFVVAVVLAIFAARLANAAFDVGDPIRLPIFAGLTAGTMLFLLVPARRRDEAVAMARIAAVQVGFLLAVALLAGAGSGDAVTLLLVPLTFVALYVRRYGRSAQNDGIALFEIALTVATTAPTRHEALWFAAVLVMLAVSLLRARAAPGSG